MIPAGMMGPGPAPLVRYRFDGGARVDLHFHVVEGRTLFFFPARVPQREGASIWVEFAVASEMPTLLRGRINSHETPGSWIEFAAEGLPRLVLGGSEKPRAHVRAAVDVTVLIKRSDATKIVCRITDASEGGTRMSGLPCTLEPGEEVLLSLLGGPAAQSNLGTARIVWARAKEAGASFVGPLAPAFARVLRQAIALRGSALEMSHPARCRCAAGQAPNDPRTPRAIGRDRLT